MKELYAGEEAAKPTATKKGKTVRKFKNAYQVLIKPLITEKAANMGAENKYVFEVSTKANKIEVAKAIEEVYGIKPVSVNMITKKGKNVQYGRISGKRKAWKKAIVALPQGKTINIYEGV